MNTFPSHISSVEKFPLPLILKQFYGKQTFWSRYLNYFLFPAARLLALLCKAAVKFAASSSISSLSPDASVTYQHQHRALSQNTLNKMNLHNQCTHSTTPLHIYKPSQVMLLQYNTRRCVWYVWLCNTWYITIFGGTNEQRQTSNRLNTTPHHTTQHNTMTRYTVPE